MARLVSVLVFILVALVSSSALAQECHPGDVEMGPNCVHQEEVDHYVVHSVVYRVEGGSDHEVWSGTGEVEKSTASYLKVWELVLVPDQGMVWQTVTHPWDAESQTYR